MSNFLLAVLDDPAIRSGTFTVTRRGAATQDGNGRKVAGASATFAISASVQPVQDGRVLELLAEASHGREVRLVMTATAAIDPVTPTQGADQIAIDGEIWTVISAEHWAIDGEAWTNAYVAREKLP